MAHTVHDITIADTLPIREEKESTDSIIVPHEPKIPDIPHLPIDVQVAELPDSLPTINDLPTNILKRVVFKYKRWRDNAWKHRLCYKESMWSSFWSGVWMHLLKPSQI